MPVRRHQHDRIGSVYAFSSELDAWVQSRRLRLEEEEKEATAETPVDAKGDHASGRTSRTARWLVLGGVGVLALLALTFLMTRSPRTAATQPKITSLAELPFQQLAWLPTQANIADAPARA